MLRIQHIYMRGSVAKQTYSVSREHAFGGYPPGHVAVSHSLICPRCQNNWALLVFPDDPSKCTWPRAQFCENCEPPPNTLDWSWHPVPGSLLVEEGFGVIDESLLNSFPKILLEREVRLHLKAFL